MTETSSSTELPENPTTTDDLRRLFREQYEDMSHTPIEFLAHRYAESDVEIRRGLIAINGAALVAIIALLGTKLPSAILTFSAWAYFWGLATAIAAWMLGEFSLVAEYFHARSKSYARDIIAHPQFKNAAIRPSFAEIAEFGIIGTFLYGKLFAKLSGALGIIAGLFSVSLFFAGCISILNSLPLKEALAETTGATTAKAAAPAQNMGFRASR